MNQPRPDGSSDPMNIQGPSTSAIKVFHNQGDASVPSIRNLKRTRYADDGNDSNVKRRCLSSNTYNANRISYRRTQGKKKYRLRGLTKPVNGNLCQLKHYMLILQRASKLGYSFRLAKEMEAADKLDDLVFEYKAENSTQPIHRFVQFNYRAEESAEKGQIRVSELLNVDEGDFSLLKYFEFSESKLKDYILCTNIDPDIEGLREKRINVEPVRDCDGFLKVTSSFKDREPRCFRFEVKKNYDLHHILRGASDVHRLAKVLAEHFREPKKLTLTTDLLKKYHVALANEVVDVDLKRFKENFIDPAKCHNLTTKAKKFREIFLSHVKDLTSMKKLPDSDVWKKLGNFKFDLAGTFGQGEVIDLPDDCISDDQISDFFGEFMIAVDQPNEAQLTEIMSDEMATKLNLLNAGSPMDYFRTAVFNWFKGVGTQGRYLTEIDAEELFDGIRDRLSILKISGVSSRYRAKLEDHDIKFEGENTKLVEFLEHSNPVPSRRFTLTSSNETLLLALSVHQTLKRMNKHEEDDGCIFISLEDFLLTDISEHALRAFSSSCSDGLLIIDCGANIGKLLKHETWNSLLNIIEPVTETDGSNKLILITQGANNSAIPEEEYYDISFEHLDIYSRRKVLQKIVKFQGRAELSWGTLLGISDSGNVGIEELEDLSQIIDVDTLVKLIQSKSIEIGNEIEGLDVDADFYYVDRIIVRSSGTENRMLQKLGSASRADIDEAQQNTVCLKGDELLDRHDQRKIVILSAAAGMGKSTLLTKLALKMKREPSMLVIRIDLSSREITRALDEEENKRSFDVGDTKKAVDFLVDKLVRPDRLGSQVYKRLIMKVKSRAVLLFDGFDVISPKYTDTVCDLLQALGRLGIKNLVITTRPRTKDTLELKMEIRSHTLQPFSEHDQRTFLIKFWKRRLGLTGIDETVENRLQNHAQNVIRLLSNSINDRMREFTGIPLHTRMVAEVYSVVYGKEEQSVVIPSLPERIDSIELYAKFVTKKYDVYFEEKNHGDTSKQGQKSGDNMCGEISDAVHQKLALETLFDKEVVEALLLSQKTIGEYFDLWQEKHKGEERTGIITQVVDGKPQFIHRTFAEYFAAVFLFNTLKDDSRNKDLREFFLAKCFLAPEYETIRAFMNCLLTNESISPDKDPWMVDLRKYSTEDHDETIYHTAARERNSAIVRFFSNCLNPTLQNIAEFANQNVVCVKTGSGDLNKSNCKSTQESVKNVTDCAELNIDIRNKYGSTALLLAVCGKGDLELIDCLLNGGANIHTEDQSGKSPLHEACDRSSVELVKFLINRGANIHAKDINGKTPLHYASMRHALTLFTFSGNRNIKRVNGRPLHSATRSDKLAVAKFLLDKGAIIDVCDADGRTPLHEASEFGNLILAKFLINKGATVNTQDKYGKTPLHDAIHSDEVEVVKVLINGGANLQTRDILEKTPLDYATRYVREKVSNFSLERGIQFMQI